MEIEDLGKGFCQVLEQVKAISHLGCRGGPLPRAVGISFRAIAGDDLDPRVGLKPVRQGLRLTVREHGDRLAMFQVNQHGPIRLAFAEREVIHSKDSRGPTGRHWQPADSPQERVATPGNAQLLTQPGPRCAAEHHSDRDQPVCEPLRPPRPWADKLGQSLGEDVARTAPVATEKLSDAQLQDDTAVRPWEVRDSTPIATVDAPGRKPAHRTVHQGLYRGHAQSQPRCHLVQRPRLQVQ